ncbi:uncharacterized protein METZ01_LOCUS257065, partial [marine metagenome]
MPKSEKVIVKKYTKELLNKKKCPELKQICKSKKIDGYNGEKKKKLIELILEEEVKIDEKDKIEESEEESESELESTSEISEEESEEEVGNKYNGTTIICLKDGNIFKK